MKLLTTKALIASALVIAFGLFYYYSFYITHPGRHLLPLYHLRMALVQYATANGAYPESLDTLDREELSFQPFTYQYKFHYLAEGIEPARYDERIPLLLAYDRTSPLRFLIYDSGRASYILDALDKMGRTALHAADADATRFLLAEGNIEIDHRDNFGTTPLSIASSRGNIHVVRLLLANGANPNIADNNGVTPLCHASAVGGIPLRYVHTSEFVSDFPAVIQALLDAGAEYDIFSATALGNKEYLIRALDTHPQVVYAKGLNGFTLLHVAASHNNIDIAKLLLEHGADPLLSVVCQSDDRLSSTARARLTFSSMDSALADQIKGLGFSL